MDERIAISEATIDPIGTPVVLASSESPAIRTEAMPFHMGASEESRDFTDIVRNVAKRSTVRHGQVTVHTPHTTRSIVINESETGFLNDFRRAIDRMIPVDTYYEHDDHDVRTENMQEDESINGYSHIRQLLTGEPSVTIPIVDGEVLRPVTASPLRRTRPAERTASLLPRPRRLIRPHRMSSASPTSHTTRVLPSRTRRSRSCSWR